MAELITTGKGFKVIHLTQEETRKAGWGIDSTGECLCSHCNKSIDPENIYYPIVLGDTMCTKCYMEWYNRDSTHKYPEEDKYEVDMLLQLKESFNIEQVQ